ncbi:MAG: hypothetical protein IPM37_07755 [Hahellaceae bacterium]|nr:hypothetical protein [Hahellaceae bacterium]
MPTGATAAQTTLDPRTLDTSTFTSTPFTDEVNDKAHRKIDSIAEKAANAEAVLRQKAEQASETLEL